MTRPYTPQPGTIPHKAIEHLKTLPPGAELATPALAEALGCTEANFGAYLHNALKGGALKNRKRSGERWVLWSLGDGKPVSAQIDGEDDVDAPLRTRGRPLTQAPVSSVFDIGRGVDMDAVHHRHDNVVEMEPAAKPPAALGWKHANGGPVPAGKPYTVGTGDREHHIPRPAACTPVSARSEAAPAAQPTGTGEGVATPKDGCPTDEPDAHEHFARTTIDEPAPMPAPPLPRVRAGTAPGRWGIFSDGELHIEKAGQQIVLVRREFEAFVAFLERMGVVQA